jgi:hypothetical protein
MYEGCSKHMIKVAVCAEVMYGLQLLFFDVILDSSLFGIIKGTTVNDDTLFGVVAHYVAVLLQRIHLENLDRKHGYSGK